MKFIAILLCVVSASAWATENDSDIKVRVRKEGAVVSIDVDCPVAAPAEIAWDVLTDYDGMARFVSNLVESRVESRSDGKLRVYQKGRVTKGPFSASFEILREVELVRPDEIRSTLVSGDFETSNFVTRIDASGAVVHVINSGQYTPKSWVPPMLGPALIESETRKQYGDIRAEILNRARARKPGATLK